MLDAQVIRPDDDLPHPLVVFSHTYHSDPKRIYADFMRLPAVEYARRGLTTFAFTRRGFGLSGGKAISEVSVCNVADITRFNNESLEDVREAIRLISLKPYVDATKIIAIGGQSGGFLSIALTGSPPPGLVAAISFDGEITTRSETRICGPNSPVASMAKIGEVSRIPTLWIYANDRRVPQKTSTAMAKVFIESGGNVELFHTSPVGIDDRFPFEKGSSTWDKYLSPFLKKVGVRTLDDPIPGNRIRVIYGTKRE